MKKESMKKEIIELIEQIDNTRYLRIIITYLIGIVKGQDFGSFGTPKKN